MRSPSFSRKEDALFLWNHIMKVLLCQQKADTDPQTQVAYFSQNAFEKK